MEMIGTQRLSVVRIRRINGTSRTAGVFTQVMAPIDQGEWTQIQDNKHIWKTVLLAYKVNLTQANSTPCIHSP